MVNISAQEDYICAALLVAPFVLFIFKIKKEKKINMGWYGINEKRPVFVYDKQYLSMVHYYTYIL